MTGGNSRSSWLLRSQSWRNGGRTLGRSGEEAAVILGVAVDRPGELVGRGFGQCRRGRLRDEAGVGVVDAASSVAFVEVAGEGRGCDQDDESQKDRRSRRRRRNMRLGGPLIAGWPARQAASLREAPAACLALCRGGLLPRPGSGGGPGGLGGRRGLRSASPGGGGPMGDPADHRGGDSASSQIGPGRGEEVSAPRSGR